MTTEQWYSADFGIEVDEAGWEADYEKVVDDLAAHLEQVTGIVLTGWDSPARGGVYFEGRDEQEGGQETILWLRPNYVPESGDWGFEDYREYTVIANVLGSNPDQVDELREAILASEDLGATLLFREIVRPNQRIEVVYSLKDSGRAG